jgi:uncharacterized phiE125 gp8 family phage protein
MNHRSLVLKTAPATQIVSTADMKTYLQVDDAVDDTEITEAIVASREAIENYTGRSLINTVWNLWLDSWPRDKKAENPPSGVYDLPINAFDRQLSYIELPRAPLVSVASIKYYDTADSVATFSSGSYLVDTNSVPSRVCLNYNTQWPTTLLRPCNGIDIEFTSGYGTATTDVPDSILLAVKQMTKFNYRVMTGGYEEGETLAFESDKNKSGLTDFVEKLLMPYRIVRF